MALETELKEAIEGIGRRFEEFKTENDKLIKKGVKDALAEAKLEQLGQAIDDLTGKKEDLENRIKAEAEYREALERKFNLLSVQGSAKTDDVEQKALADMNLQIKVLAKRHGRAEPTALDVEGFRGYKRAFFSYCRTFDDKLLGADELKALQVGSDPAGGYWVPADTGGRIVARVYDLSPIRQIASVQPISTDRLEGVGDINDITSGWVGETQARTETNTPDVGKYDIPVHEMYAMPKASQKVLDDAAIDLEAWLTGKVAPHFARKEGAAFVAGDGVLKPRGFTAYTTAATADASRAWGQLEHINTGVNADFAATNPADVLYDLEGAFKAAHLANSNFVTKRQVVTKIRKFKGSDNNYLWQPGLQAGRPNTLIGYPIVMAEDMPVLAAGSLSLSLGDFRHGYQIVDRVGIRLLRDPYTSKPHVLFYFTSRVGGGVVDFEAIKFVRFSA